MIPSKVWFFIAAALLTLNSATFYYVISIEKRLTRLETIDELERMRRQRTLEESRQT